jgi:threonine synthase
MYVTHLSCFQCGKEYEKQKIYQLCQTCAKPLKVHHNLKKVAEHLSPNKLIGRTSTLWRYREVLPVEKEENIVSLGEGFTPLFHAKNLGKAHNLIKLYIKDEGLNPTASFKARGMTMAISMAKELGLKKLAVPTAGNAGGALAAYAAKAGMEAYIFMPKDVPLANRLEAESCGAKVTLIDGLITDCAKVVMENKDKEGWFDVSTLKEPYRIEGKKTMGYEIAEQFNWQLPDAIIYPTGGGTGLIGMWKAFDEMQEMGWIDSKRPKMISVQATGCAPMVEIFNTSTPGVEIKNAHTVASGLRVPKAIGDFIMLDILHRSQGTALAVSDSELLAGAREISRLEGIFAAPEGGATLAALDKLMESNFIKPEDQVVLFNTGSGVKYLEAFQ